MAKRAKAAKKAKAARPKTEQAEPFFRPFSKLNATRAKKLAEKNAKAASDESPKAAKPDTSKPSKADARSNARASVRPNDDEPVPVDPQTFAIYMAGVRALPEDRAHRIPLTASKLERAARGSAADAGLDDDARARMRSLVTEGIRFETVDDGERIEGRRLDIDPRELRRLRRGQYAVDGRIDLHGLAVEEARAAVEAYVKKRARDGDRVVLVVHGKGTHSPRGHGVLRGEIAAWLSQGRSARHIAAFATAPDDHGGTGALLVLLAR